MVVPPFEDIVIVDLDVQKTTWSRVHSAMRTLYLRLNRDPDLAWNKFFFEERNSRVEVKRHGLWIEDGYIVFDCLLIDVDTYHLPDIRRSIAYANERSRELRAAQLEEREQLKAKARDEAEVLKALRANIREERPSPAAPAVFDPDSTPEPATAHALEAAADAQLESAAEPAETPYERRLREFYDAFAPKAAAAPKPSPQPTAPASPKPLPTTQAPAPRALPEPAPPAAIDAAPIAAEARPSTAEPGLIAAQPTSPAAEPRLIAPAPTQETAAAPAPEPTPASELDLQSKRDDWRARFRAAFERNKN